MDSFVPIDLHVHTPASKCYKGGQSDEEYVDIIKNYAEKGVRIIAITDHNTIRGYRVICRIQEDIRRRIDILCEFAGDSKSVREELDRLNSIQSFFKEVLILPGVEFEANPGIHLLFIFDPSKDLSSVEKLLVEGGYSESEQGKESSSANVCWDVLESLKRAKELGAITIAAHIDSNKGIYNDLTGSYRARVFKSENLDAVSVNSVVTIDKIQELLKQEDYRRSSQLAIIQSSDHHQLSDCAKMITFANLNSLSFAELVTAFKNPNENISPTAVPETKHIISQIANDPSTILLGEYSEDDICSGACAILNRGYGTLLLGVSCGQYRNIKGVFQDEGLVDRVIESINNNLVPGKLFYTVNAKSWKWGVKTVFAFSFSNNSNKQFYYRKQLFSILDHSAVECKNNKENDNVSLIDLGITKRLQDSLFDEMQSLSDRLVILSEQKYIYPIIHNVESDGIRLASMFDVNVIDSDIEVSDDDYPPFGYSYGRNYGVPDYERIRTKDYYVRITPYRLSGKDNKKNKVIGPGVVIIPGGAVFLVEEPEASVCSMIRSALPILFFRLSKGYEQISIYTIIAWIKSSVFLWYINTVFGTSNIYRYSVFQKLFIPIVLFEDVISSKLETKVKEILLMETEFLKEQERRIANGEIKQNDNQEWESFAIMHNKKVDVIALEIDRIINEALGLDEQTEKYLQHFLTLDGFHCLN